MNTFRYPLHYLIVLALVGCNSTAPQFGLGLGKRKAEQQNDIASTDDPTSNSLTGNDMHGPAQHDLTSHDSTQLAVLLTQGQNAMVTGDYQQAEQLFQQVLQVDPQNATAHHRLAVMADQQQDYSAAESHYLIALQGNPRDANLLSDIGYSYLLRGQNEMSMKYLKDALRINPGHVQAANNLGVIYAHAGNTEQALEMFRKSASEQEAQAKLAHVLANNSSERMLAGASADLGTADGNSASLSPFGGKKPNPNESSDLQNQLLAQMRQAKNDSLTQRRQLDLQQQALEQQERALARQRQWEYEQQFQSANDGQSRQPGNGMEFSDTGEYLDDASRYSSREPQPAGDPRFDSYPQGYQSYENAENEYRDDPYRMSPPASLGIEDYPTRGEPPSRVVPTGGAQEDLDPHAVWPPRDDAAQQLNGSRQGSNASRNSEPIEDWPGAKSASRAAPANRDPRAVDPRSRQGIIDVNPYSQTDPRTAGIEITPAGGTPAARNNRYDTQLDVDGSYQDDGIQPTAAYENVSTANPRQYISAEGHERDGQSARKAAMLMGMNAGPAQLFPVHPETESRAGEFQESFPSTRTRLGSEFASPGRLMPHDLERQHDVDDLNDPQGPNSGRAGYDFPQPGRARSVLDANAENSRHAEDEFPSAWDEPSPAQRALRSNDYRR